MDDEHVWYACYGSNINHERFLHYIDGKERTICGHHFKSWNGCTDKNPSLKTQPYEFKHNVYFANESSSWGNKGVAFIDLENPGFAYGRIYLITKEQFSQIRCKEGRGLDWYGYPRNDFTDPIDEIDGIKVYTFTQVNNKIPRNAPAEDYTCVIIQGLMEIGLTESDAREYFARCVDQ